MKELFYTPIDVEKDVYMGRIIKDIEDNPACIVLKKPEEHLVHEMTDYDIKSGYKDSGKTHVGYWYHYVTFGYRGFIFNIEPCSYYPFTDENDPGLFNFVAYQRVGLSRKHQITYSIRYEGIQSVDNWIDEGVTHEFGWSQVRDQDINFRYGDDRKVKEITELRGGNREKCIMSQNPFLIETETMNKEHKVFDIVSSVFDPETGHRDSFSVDLVTGKICG